MQTILSDNDIRYIMNAELDAASDLQDVAEDLYVTLLAVAKATNLRKRFYEAMYHKRSTFFQLYQTPVIHRIGENSVSIVLAMINHDVLHRFSEMCGKGVHASYSVEKYNLNIFVEFLPLSAEDVEKKTAEALLERRLEKETSW